MSCVNEEETISWSCWLRTLSAASGALIAVLFLGVIEAQSAVMLPQLREADSPFHVTPNEETWIASLGIILAPIAALFAGPFIDMFGRKRGLQYFFFNMGLGFGIIACADNVYYLYVGRIICGIGTGLQACSMVYITEICNTKMRCDLLSAISGMVSGGMALCIVVGSYLPWKLESLIFSFACFVFFIFQFFIPESPPWLFRSDKEHACTQNFRRFGRSEKDIHQQLDALRQSTKDQEDKVKFKTFLQPTVWKPFVIMFIMFFLQSASGVYVVIYYSVDFVETLGTKYDALGVSTICSAARFLSTVTVGMFFRLKCGRKFTLAFSAFGMMVTFVGMGIYEYIYRDTSVAWRPYQWVPVGLMLLYMATSVIGMLGLPWAMTGEMFPLKVRGTMTSLTYFFGYGFMFVFVKMYQKCLNLLQIYGLLFAFALFSSLAVLFMAFVLPETNNKSLLEIEQYFLPKKAEKKSADSDETRY